MNSETEVQTPNLNPNSSNQKHLDRLKIAAAVFTVLGIALFGYFIWSVGFYELVLGTQKIGIDGFFALIVIYFLRLMARAEAWKLSVYEPYALDLRDTLPAVIIGEAMSTMIPLGILVSGTTKAVAVRKRVPMVVGLSSVATENLFYSLVTGLFIVLGAFAFLRSFELAEGWTITIDALIGLIIALMFLGVVMVVRQWHFASAICEKLYDKGYARKSLENGRLHVRLFENLIYGFYRRYPKRFLPIIALETLFHALGILEIWLVLSRITGTFPSLFTSFLLESVSRIITTTFKLIPFVIGVDEAGAKFVTETLALGAGIGITLAIIRKGRVIFWTIVGLILLLKRGLSLKEISSLRHENHELKPE
ncbi:MAG TPA: lysylphosphatidylglycerol synthase domain-containing protein [Pyrinomonadaceae bacterium]